LLNALLVASLLTPLIAGMAGEGRIMRGHRNGVRGVEWNPVCGNVVATVGMDQTVRVWDAGRGEEVTSLEGLHEDTINNVTWNYGGDGMVSGCRDKKARILDVRQGKVVEEWKAHEGARGCRVEWCGTKDDPRGVVLTMGNGMVGERQVKLWDTRNLSKPVVTKNVDNGNGVLFSMWDECTGLVWIAGRGDRTVKYYDVNHDEVVPGQWDCTMCHEFTFEGDPTVGIAPLPRTAWNVNEVQVGGFVRLSKGECQEGSFFLPRNNDLKGYFQDDVYGEFRDPERSNEVTPVDWIGGSNPEVKVGLEKELSESKSIILPSYITNNLPLVASFLASQHCTLNDGTLPLLSTRVVTRTARSKTAAFREEIDKQEEEDKHKNQMFEKMQSMAITHEKWHPNKSMGGGGGGGGSKPQDTTPKKAHVDCQPIYDSSDDEGWSD